VSGKFNGHGDQESFKKWLMAEIDELYLLADEQDGCGIREKFKEMVPEYQPGDTECVL